MSEPLHTKYRPTDLTQMIGLGATFVNSLNRVIRENKSHAFLFHGPSGCGKTTLARITAKLVGCDERSITEVDAATHTGVDSMREVQNTLLYKPLGGKGSRAVILDECHALSKQSWQSLLKSIEEPPKHAYWFFCTTEPGKVPDTIRTRCASFALPLPEYSEIEELVEFVATQEGMEVHADVLRLIASESNRSPRQALVNLAIAGHAKNKKIAAKILRTALESDPVIELCRMLLNKPSWSKAMALVTALEGTEPESTRIVVCNYFAKVLQSAKSEKTIMQCLAVLEAFETPYNRSENNAPLLLSLGRLMYGD